MRRNNGGFTLIELIVVIVILGILAVTAAPKFIDLQSDARLATLNGMKAAINSAVSLTYGKSLVLGKEKADEGPITINGSPVTVCYDQVMTTVEKICGYNVLTESIRIVPDNKLAIKRLFDVFGSIIGLIINGIIIIFVGPLIYFSDPGPIFFSQERVGENGRKFRIYKLRSMYLDAEKRKKELMEKNEMSGHMFKMENDPRIIGSGPDGTRHGIGWFIRKTSLDEFPQFWNVLKGDMSLVGTRPPTVEEYENYELHHKARLSFKPGITGLWQVSGRSDITDFEEVVKLDMEYINNWTLGEDIKIICRTILQVLTGSGAK